ncbi:hypothetical protein EK21DRAFT_94245 [Setomelanomma holmii]|uniref:Uncharacterized protein n=1 Tax=Setomelanomma holmii TaxID=210430 RepID=A0A9P4LH52_9PLEO|nr:hypothetical protein EK21DRAFT_94245 [Setomelanomma holmii]
MQKRRREHSRMAPGEKITSDVDDQDTMKGWQEISGIQSRPKRQAKTPRFPCNAARDFASAGRREHSRMPMTPPTTVKRPSRRVPSAIAQTKGTNHPQTDAHTSAMPTPTTPPAAKSQTHNKGEVKAKDEPRRPKQYRAPTRYNPNFDAKYHPIRDSGHEIHHGCVSPRPSVEDACARQQRFLERGRRPY